MLNLSAEIQKHLIAQEERAASNVIFYVSKGNIEVLLESRMPATFWLKAPTFPFQP